MSAKSIAVVGAGLIGKRHVEIVSRLPQTNLAAIVDPSPQSVGLADQMGTQHFGDIGNMLTQVKPDGVIIASPNQLHVHQGLQCVAAGVPMLIEKPIDSSVEAATELVEQAAIKSVPIAVGHHRRHNPIIQSAKSRIEAGEIGDIVAVQAACWLYKPDDYFQVEWRTKSGAGPIFINLIHDIDLMRHLCGEITAVQAMQSSKSRGHEVEDTAAITLQFDNGALGTMSVSDTIVAPWSWELTAAENPAYPSTGQSCYLIGGTHGSVEVPTGRVWTQNDPRSWWEPINNKSIDIEMHDPLDAQILQFCRVIEGSEPPLVSGEEGLRTLIALEAVKRSAATGKLVRL